MEDSERIELPNQNYWEIKTTVTRGMRKAFRKAGLAGFVKGIEKGVDIDFSNQDSLRKAVLANPGAWDLDAIDDAYLLVGSVAYSFGDKVDLATIDGLDDKYVEPVLSRMRELYAEIGEEQRQGFSGRQ